MTEEEPVKDFSCPICLEVLYRPYTIIDCQHSVCLECVNRLYATSANPLCPVCRSALDPSTHPERYNHTLDDCVKGMCPRAWKERASRPQEKPRDIRAEVISGIEREIVRDDLPAAQRAFVLGRYETVPAAVYHPSAHRELSRRRAPLAYEPWEQTIVECVGRELARQRPMYYPPPQPRMIMQPRNPVRDISVGACVILSMFMAILCMLYYFVSLMRHMIH